MIRTTLCTMSGNEMNSEQRPVIRRPTIVNVKILPLPHNYNAHICRRIFVGFLFIVYAFIVCFFYVCFLCAAPVA